MQYLLAAIFACPFVYLLSFNCWLWLEAGLTLLVSIALIYRHQRIYPALIWVVGFSWLGIVAAIITADLHGMNLADLNIGPSRVEAVHLSMVALVVFGAGLASGLLIANRHSNLKDHVTNFEHGINLHRAVFAYFCALGLADIAAILMIFVPQLQQQLYMLQMLKFACIYVVAWTVFATSRGYPWLLAMLAVEVVTGLTGFFGTFKEGFFIVLIALLGVGRRPPKRMWSFGVAVALCVVMLSVIWTSVKKDYRQWVSGGTWQQIVVQGFDERVSWMFDHISVSEIDYPQTLQTMFTRIDNTAIYAEYLMKADAGYVFDLPSRYLAGFENILMPRILFPNKGVINDSEATTAMTGMRFDENTSVSIGYIAEAQYDFGIPWMFVPIFLIGMVMALAPRYFMDRNAPYVIRQAFATTLLFNSFVFGANFNKAFGGFLMEFLVLALVLRFAYPLIGGWLTGPRSDAEKVGLAAQREMIPVAYSARDSLNPRTELW